MEQFQLQFAVEKNELLENLISVERRVKQLEDELHAMKTAVARTAIETTVHNCNTGPSPVVPIITSNFSGERFDCELCSKTFTRRSNQRQHERSVHFCERILCPLCNRSFSRMWRMRNHVKLAHADMLPTDK